MAQPFYRQNVPFLRKNLVTGAKNLQNPLEKGAGLVYNKMNCIIRPKLLTVNIGGQTKW